MAPKKKGKRKASDPANSPEKAKDIDLRDIPELNPGAVLGEGSGNRVLITRAPGSSLPQIHPLKAAKILELDGGEGFGPWPVLIATRAYQQLRQLKDPVKLDTVEKKLVELSKGNFGGDNQKTLIGGDRDIPIFEAKLLGDFRLVYQVDLIPIDSPDGSTTERSKQCLRVFGFETHATIDKRFGAEAVARSQSRNAGPDYKRNCLHRRAPPGGGGKVNQRECLPATFPFVKELDTQVKAEPDGLTDQQRLEAHSIISLSKYIPLSRDIMISLIADEENAQHPFALSKREREITNHPGTSLLLGRSGTGKTSCIVFKLLSMQRAYEITPELAEEKKIRQLFLTHSPILSARVGEYYAQLLHTVQTRGNRSLEEAVAAAKKRHEAEEREDAEILEDVEDEHLGLRGLPPKFSDLTDEHFPLFLSYDSLLHLLEADFDIKRGATKATAGQKRATRRGNKKETSKEPFDMIQHDDDDEDAPATLPATAAAPQQWEHFVDYEQSKDWFPSFSQGLTKGLNPALCWSEILGVIKGSEAAAESELCALSESEYISLSQRTNTTYASSRDRVYAIFQQYTERKRAQGDFDRADRTHAIVAGLRGRPIDLDHQMTHIYVDEAQDLLLADFTLLRYLSTNPQGWFLAGDTAQTISAGSAFRFDDLKALFWRAEQKDAERAKREPVEAQMFTLDVNYRSHGGITDVAQNLVSIILKLYPDSIDRLPPESALVAGPKPTWVLPRSEGNEVEGSSMYTNFLFDVRSTNVDFGAEQCILVRDEAAREKLRSVIGDIGLTLTIAESKGLEFTDVLLLDFFADSPVKESDWRVLLNMLKEPPAATPTFDEVRHAAISVELRHLYVACTRARKTLWIMDTTMVGDSVRVVLEDQNAVKTLQPSEALPAIATASTPETWEAQGNAMHSRKNYVQAAFCFGKANMPVQQNTALAYHERHKLRQESKNTGAAPSTFAVEYERVAKLFQEAAKDAVKAQAKSLQIVAAECYIHAGKKAEAAKAFKDGGNFERAAYLFSEIRDHIQAIAVAKKCDNPEVYNKIVGPARFFFVKNSQFENAKGVFDSDEQLLEFMDLRGFSKSKRAYLLKTGNLALVAKLDYEAGDLVSASEFYLKVGDRRSRIEAVKCQVELLQRTLPMGCLDESGEHEARKHTKDALQYIATATKTLELIEGDFPGRKQWEQETELYSLIAKEDSAALLALSSRQNEDWTIQLNALDVALSQLPEFEGGALLDDLLIYLGHVTKYSDLILRMVKTLDVTDKATQRLLGFDTRTEEENSGDIRILGTSPLSDMLQVGDADRTEAGVTWTMSPFDLKKSARSFLMKRVGDFWLGVSGAVRKAPCLRPFCSAQSLTSVCEDLDCESLHIDPGLFAPTIGHQAYITGRLLRLLSTKVPVPHGSKTRERINTRKYEDALLFARASHPLVGTLTNELHLSRNRQASEVKALNDALSAAALENLSKMTETDALSTDFIVYTILAAEHGDNLLFNNVETLKVSRNAAARKFIEFFLPSRNVPAYRDAVWKTLSALEHAYTQGTPVEARYFNYMLDKISTHALLRDYPKEQKEPWHGIVLPESGVHRLANRLIKFPLAKFDLPDQLRFVSFLWKVTDDVLRGTSNLRLDGEKLSYELGACVAIRFAGIAISVAYRTNDKARDELTRGLSRVGVDIKSGAISDRQLPAHHPSFQKLVNVKTWEDLLGRYAELCSTKQEDPLIEVVRIPAEKTWPAKTPIKTIPATSLQELETKLAPPALGPQTSVFLAKAPPKKAPVLDVDSAAEAAQQDKAARVLQRWLPNAARRAKYDNQRIEQRGSLFQTVFAKYTKERDGKKPRPVVRGPVVELVYALEGYRKVMLDGKRQLAHRLSDPKDPLSPHEIGEKQDKLMEALKKLEEYLAKLRPDAPLVVAGDLARFRGELADLPKFKTTIVSTLKDVLERKPAALKALPVYARHFDLGVRGILTRAAPAKAVPSRRAPKPVLNTRAEDDERTDYRNIREDEDESESDEEDEATDGEDDGPAASPVTFVQPSTSTSAGTPARARAGNGATSTPGRGGARTSNANVAARQAAASARAAAQAAPTTTLSFVAGETSSRPAACRWSAHFVRPDHDRHLDGRSNPSS